MGYIVNLSELAKSQLEIIFQSYPKSVSERLVRILTDDLVNHPRTGIGRPELHKGTKRWTRRLTHGDRIQYYIHDRIVEVEVIKLLGHNDDH